MDRAKVFAAWAPGDSIWTPWVKPILFAHVAEDTPVPLAIERPHWAREELLLGPKPDSDYRSLAMRTRAKMPAIIVDLPGAQGVAAGIALAEIGFRPVPLYTAVPALAAIVPMDEVVEAIAAAAVGLEATRLAPNAPPAFLLDARRAGRPGAARVGQFDNRSIAFAADFPSVARLRREGADSVILITAAERDPASDLASILDEWQRDGLAVLVMHPESTRGPEPYRMQSSIFMARIELFFKRLALHRREDGGFGQLIIRHPHTG